jgi:serine/threonine protein kinase
MGNKLSSDRLQDLVSCGEVAEPAPACSDQIGLVKDNKIEGSDSPFGFCKRTTISLLLLTVAFRTLYIAFVPLSSPPCIDTMSTPVQGSTARIIITGNQAEKVYSGNAENFRRECEVLQRLKGHPNVVELLEIRERTIVLQAGQCLREVLKKRNVSTKQQEKWVNDLARGLEHMHEKQVIHADVNAANVIIREDQAMWIDFGGSQIDDQEALANYDEYSYRPPEHADPPVSRATDIFAFGCAVFEIETGAPPFYHETRHMCQNERLSYMEDMYRERCFPSVESLRFRPIITGCWHGRYSSMSDLREELKSMEVQRSRQPPSCNLLATITAIRNRLLRLWPGQSTGAAQVEGCSSSLDGGDDRF